MKYLFVILASVLTMTCAGNRKASSDWCEGWNIEPSATVNVENVKAHIAAHPERWQKTFEFLQNNNLDSLSLGRHEILGKEVYANVSEYMPDEPAKRRFEAHRTYIDLQYIIRGEELMGVTTLDKLTPLVEYNAKKDVALFAPETEAQYEVATPEKFYIFFPQEPHRPNIINTPGVKVRKIVIKIMY